MIPTEIKMILTEIKIVNLEFPKSSTKMLLKKETEFDNLQDAKRYLVHRRKSRRYKYILQNNKLADMLNKEDTIRKYYSFISNAEYGMLLRRLK